MDSLSSASITYIPFVKSRLHALPRVSQYTNITSFRRGDFVRFDQALVDSDHDYEKKVAGIVLSAGNVERGVVVGVRLGEPGMSPFAVVETTETAVARRFGDALNSLNVTSSPLDHNALAPTRSRGQPCSSEHGPISSSLRSSTGACS